MILQYIGPATLSVVWNIKIIQIAVLFRIVLRRRLSLLKWIAVLLLFFGVIASQSSKIHVTHQRLVCSVNSYEEESIFCLANSAQLAAVGNETVSKAFEQTVTRVRATHSKPPEHYIIGWVNKYVSLCGVFSDPHVLNIYYSFFAALFSL